MGFWGTEPRDNDGALDYVDEVCEFAVKKVGEILTIFQGILINTVAIENFTVVSDRSPAVP